MTGNLSKENAHTTRVKDKTITLNKLSDGVQEIISESSKAAHTATETASVAVQKAESVQSDLSQHTS
ncbi:MAG: hypothetical protein PUF08_03090, partial [Clostridiales bacterium]|nr:hypothetical protein [Clostridiales bacterium]